MTEPPNCFATLKIIGSITTRPASKKIGKPNNNDAIPNANGALFSPNLLISVSANTFAPPVISSKRPIIAPKPTNKATEASVLPKPPSKVGKILSIGIPVTSAVNKLTISNATNAWTLNFIIRTNSNRIAASIISINIVIPF